MNQKEIINKLKEMYAVKELKYLGELKVHSIKHNRKGHMYKIKFKDLTNKKNKILYFDENLSILPVKSEIYHFTFDGVFDDIYEEKVYSYSLDDLKNKHINLYYDESNRQILL